MAALGPTLVAHKGRRLALDEALTDSLLRIYLVRSDCLSRLDKIPPDEDIRPGQARLCHAPSWAARITIITGKRRRVSHSSEPRDGWDFPARTGVGGGLPIMPGLGRSCDEPAQPPGVGSED
jgi:hypothetical protein